MNIVIRKEIKNNEYRTPLVPTDCKKLISNGFKIYLEPCINRCFKDEEYLSNGCLILEGSYPKDAYIIGLKEFDYENKELSSYKHIYFSHCFKNQLGSEKILKCFKENNGFILDYEYIVDENNKRLIAFGFWAGFAGMCLGMLQYLQKINNLPEINNLRPCYDYKLIIKNFKKITNLSDIKIGIIGIDGRCGNGCKFFLDKLKIPYIGYRKNDPKDDLFQHNILVNCIYLSPDSDVKFITKDNLNKFENLKVIVDISCDVNSKNNPIDLEYKLTNFKKPVYKINDNIDIISIDNLPSILPKNSSIEFSDKLTKLLQQKKIWKKLKEIYQEKISFL